MEEREKNLERNLNKEVKALGGWSIKILSNFIWVYLIGSYSLMVALTLLRLSQRVRSKPYTKSNTWQLEALGFPVSVIGIQRKN